MSKYIVREGRSSVYGKSRSYRTHGGLSGTQAGILVWFRHCVYCWRVESHFRRQSVHVTVQNGSKIHSSTVIRMVVFVGMSGLVP